MRHMIKFASIVILVLSLSGIAGATSYTFQPNDPGAPDLWDLEHGRAYTWGLDWEAPAGEVIVGASLFFDNIRNWKNPAERRGENDLWVHLLDSAPIGARQLRDRTSGQVDYFDGEGVLLNQWHNLSHIPQDITYEFDAAELQALVDYMVNDGIFGFGFDPDCHFYNDGIELRIETAVAAVPEPSTVILVGFGLISLAGLIRKKRS